MTGNHVTFLAFVAGVAVGLALSLVFRIKMVLRGKPTCRDTCCDAYSWQACGGGRCKYHCDAFCKCVPVGRPGEISVIKGGKAG